MTKTKTSKPRRDVQQEVTDKIITALEAGVMPWRKDWVAARGGEFPLRVTGQRYRGINVLILWITAMERGYTSPTWMTFMQAKELGGAVRKGEKSSPVVYYGTAEKDKENAETGETETDTIRFLKHYNVFNVDQIDGLPAEYHAGPVDLLDTGTRPLDQLEAFFGRVGARIVVDGTPPCYRPQTDTVHMPPASVFTSAEGYYATLAHEVTHWTGHRSRLDRFDGDRDRAAYAREELVAELGACFVCAELGLAYDADNAAAYVASWLSALRNDKRYIFRAAGKAQAAADWIMDAAQPQAIAAE